MSTPRLGNDGLTDVERGEFRQKFDATIGRRTPAAILAAAAILDLLAPGATSATKSLLAVRLVDLVTEIARAVE